MKKLIFRLTFTIFLAIGLLQINGCGGESNSSQTQANANAEDSVKPTVPMFSAQDIEGNWRNSSEWIGKNPVVINFWGTWCPPCRKEIPDLVKLYDEYNLKGVEIISLAVNDTPGKVKNYAAQNDMDWVLLMGQDQILIDYKATNGVPTTIFIDKDGVEVGRFIGMKDFETLKRGFDAII